MAYRFSLDDVAYLIGPAGERALADAERLRLDDASWISDLSRTRSAVGERAGAVVETVRLRRRAVPKLGRSAARWLLTDEALQQASPERVAAHRAARLAGLGVHDLTCSIGGDLVHLAAACPVAVGSDLDPVRARMAAHNLAVQGRPARVAVADALRPVTRGLLGYADPARRDPAGRRITSVSTVPSIAELDDALDAAERPPVLRVPPGIDYDALSRPGEVELVSLDGIAREAVLWPPELAAVARRASVLRSGDPAADEVVTSDDPDDAGVGPAAEWIVDPDPAIVRAHLVRHYAARHRLHLLDEHLAYLSGPRPPDGVRAFRVIDAAAYRERTVAAWIARDGVGTLEIKQRGTPVIPDELRRRLRGVLRGPKRVAATLIVARIGRSAQAFWCRAAEPVRAASGDPGAEP